jgi:hypothetical protein
MSSSTLSSPADQVLQATLRHVRQEKSRRRQRRALLACVLPALAAACWLSFSSAPETLSGSPAMMVRLDHHHHLSPQDDSATLAVLVMRDGTASFEQRSANDLGDVDMTFTLDPVIAQLRN